MPDCIEALRHRPEGIRPERIAAIRVDLYSTALQYGSPTPRTDLAAPFSSRHAAALSLCLGPLRHDGFLPERLGSPDVQAVVTCARLIPDPALDMLHPENGLARVTLELADGSQTQAEVMTPKDDSSRPLTRPELQAKALGLMRAAWGQRSVPLHPRPAGQPAPDLPQQLGRVLRRCLAPQPC
jgi:2-methylcitrate dehydratase PrpD